MCTLPCSAPLRVAATWMRGGTSKGLFLRLSDLPAACQVPGPARDRLMLRLIGSPDPYRQHIDGLGGATSSTAKVVIVAPSARPDHDVDYLFGQVAIDRPLVDWSGNCGNLSAAVGPFALAHGWVDPARVPPDGLATVRIWQANIGKTIVAQVPMCGGQVQEAGDFELDGVAFPAAEIELRFLDPADDEGAVLPTGQPVEVLQLPDGVVPGGQLAATLISAGIPMVFIQAADLGYNGTEPREAINRDPALLARVEAIRVAGALRMGLIRTPEEAALRQHSPKIAWVAPAAGYVATNGRPVAASDVDVLVRGFSMGQMHHAMMGTTSVAIAAAAAIPGTLIHRAAGSVVRDTVCFGHPSGTLRVGARAECCDGPAGPQWRITEAVMSRSARVLMEGWARVPAGTV